MRPEIVLCNGKKVELGFMMDSVLTSSIFTLPNECINGLVEMLFQTNWSYEYTNRNLIPMIFESLKVHELLKRVAKELSTKSEGISFSDEWYQIHIAGLWKGDDGGDIFWPLLEAYMFSDIEYYHKPPFNGLEFAYHLSEVVGTANLKRFSKIVFARQKKMYGSDHIEKTKLSAENPHFVSFCHRVVKKIDVHRYTYNDWQAFERLLDYLDQLRQKLGEEYLLESPFYPDVLEDILKLQERMESKELQLVESDAKEHCFADAKNLAVVREFSLALWPVQFKTG